VCHTDETTQLVTCLGGGYGGGTACSTKAIRRRLAFEG